MASANGVRSSGMKGPHIARSPTRAARAAKHWIKARDTLVLEQAGVASSSGQWSSSFPLLWQASSQLGGEGDELVASAWANLSLIPKTAFWELCSQSHSTSSGLQAQLGHVYKKFTYPSYPTDSLLEAGAATRIEHWMMTQRC